MTGLAPMPYPELLRMFEAGSAAGNRYALGTRWLPELTDDAVEALAEAAITRPSPGRSWRCTSSTGPPAGSSPTTPPSRYGATTSSPR